MSTFRWKDVGDGRLGPSVAECWHGNTKLASVVGKHNEYFVTYKSDWPGEYEHLEVKDRVVLPDRENNLERIQQAVEHVLRNKAWPPWVQVFEDGPADDSVNWAREAPPTPVEQAVIDMAGGEEIF